MARLGVALTALLAAPLDSALADQDQSWIERSINTAGSATANPTSKAGSTVVTKRTVKRVVEFSGLARPDREADAGGDRQKRAGNGCIPAQLQAALNDVEARFGAVSITSTCRSRSANAAAGGASGSLHLSGEAVDFRVSGNSGAVLAFLAASSNVGGYKHYGGGLFHIDTGAKRTF
jgi:Peptidase M15